MFIKCTRGNISSEIRRVGHSCSARRNPADLVAVKSIIFTRCSTLILSYTKKNGRKRAVFVRPKPVHPESHDAETNGRITMKLLTILLTATLLLLTASAVSAQNSLPDTNDAACWQSLDALHDCAQAQQDRAMAQAERCTSYPEYQCEPESAQPQHVNTQEARLQKQKAKAASKAAQSRNNSVDNSGSEAVIIQSPAN